MINQTKFWEGYDEFKKYHNTFLCLFFHIVTVTIQSFCFVRFFLTFRPSLILIAIAIPFLTDGIGHMFEKNFKEVLENTSNNKKTNAGGVNVFYNFSYKIISFVDYFI